LARPASLSALLAQLVEALVQSADASPDQPAIGLELCLARTTQPDAALLPLEVGPTAHQSRGQMLELRELHLQLTLEAARALREDVEDQRRSIEHATGELALEIAFLARRQWMIDEDQLASVLDHGSPQHLYLAAAHERAGIRLPHRGA